MGDCEYSMADYEEDWGVHDEGEDNTMLDELIFRGARAYITGALEHLLMSRNEPTVVRVECLDGKGCPTCEAKFILRSAQMVLWSKLPNARS